MAYVKCTSCRDCGSGQKNKSRLGSRYHRWTTISLRTLLRHDGQQFFSQYTSARILHSKAFHLRQRLGSVSAQVGHQQSPWVSHELWMYLGLLFIYIQSHTSDVTRVQGLGHCCLVNDGSASCVHHHNARFHPPDLCRTKKVMSCFGQRHVHRHDIALAQEFVERDILCLTCSIHGSSIVVDDLHSEGLHPARQSLSDPAHPQDSKDLPLRIVPEADVLLEVAFSQ